MCSMKLKYCFSVMVLVLGLSTVSFGYDEEEEILQQGLPPFPKCTATCPAQYYGAGDTCTSIGKPGQVVSCGLALGRLDYQPDNTYRQSCKAVCAVK